MITQEFLSQCSDEQINRCVAWLEAKKLDIQAMQGLIMISRVSKRIFHNTHLFNPCTNPNDIMPIAFSNGIGISKLFMNSNSWVARYDSDIFSISINPLRAIAEVYILMSVNK